MKYIFPRQFGLDNVFTVSDAGGKNNHQSQSHEFRENEILKHDDQRWQRLSGTGEDCLSTLTKEKLSSKLPKRLRGQALDLAQKLRTRHARCSYGALLQHYCPADVSLCLKFVENHNLTLEKGKWSLETSLMSISCGHTKQQ